MKKVAKYLAVLLVMAFFMTPILWTAITAIKPTELISANPIVWLFQPTLEHFRVIFFEDNIAAPLVNSTIIATFSTIGVLVTAAPASYALSRFRVPFGAQLASYFLSARMAPPVTVVLPLFLIFRSLDLIDTHAALVAAYVTVNMPFAIWMIKGFFDEIPTELDEAALLDGCSRFHAFVRIVLPLAAPGLAATAIIAFIFSWNEFLFAILLTNFHARTLPVAASALMTDRMVLWGELCATALIIYLPVMLFAVLVRNYLIKGLTFGAVNQ
ncbi:MAG: carbohydrate ABC transporter permease [Verrucomicrobia bacterium]|nr:carbohydrate ABC transporter permease [Verrucomicrobiota bacterium]MBV9128784.1 carbohydrate ABC transporter permease [Verrucomicrobiota bacterium]MBV9645613.1 carbohydrate ABC transporter permease [Verrucomicrobiota bacterium]